MKELMNLIKSKEGMALLEEASKLEEHFEGKCFTIFEEKFHKQRQKKMLKQIKNIMKGKLV